MKHKLSSEYVMTPSNVMIPSKWISLIFYDPDW